MTKIFFEAHATTTDNEKHISSGHNDVGLSELGLKQAKELGERYREKALSAIFCSDLQRSFRTGEIAFAQQGIPIIRKAQLRECNYGKLNGKPNSIVSPSKVEHINEPFPNGESYEQTTERMALFLESLLRNHPQETVMIIGHRATQYSLEYWLNGIPLKEAITTPWAWQPGWIYTF